MFSFIAGAGRGLEETDSWKNLKSKILCEDPFKGGI